MNRPHNAPVPDHDPLEDTLDDEHDPLDWASGLLLSRPHSILLAEDDHDFRALLGTYLRTDGYVVDDFCDGGRLLHRLFELHGRVGADFPDLIITDVRMPGLTGIDALDFLYRVGSRIPVVVITAFGDVATHALARELGAFLVLDKPFDLSDLRRIVYCALASVDDAPHRPPHRSVS